MKLKEEYLVIALSISGILILLFTLGIQVADNKIEDWNLNKRESEFFIISGMIMRESALTKAEYYQIETDLANIKQLILKNKTRFIGRSDDLKVNYIDGNIEIKGLDKQRQDYEVFVESQKKELANLYKNPPFWFVLKQSFVIVQVFLIMISLAGYLYILLEISKRLD